jgi:rod shape-determining protein MreC
VPRSKLTAFKPLIFTVLLLCTWWAVPSAFKGLIKMTFYECQAPAWSALSKLGDLQSVWTDHTHSKREIIETGRDLAKLNSAYMLAIQESKSKDAELARLEGILGLPPLTEWRYVVARVVRRDLDTWWQRMIIQRGSGDGIQVGDGVVYRDGVVGRVVEVHAFTSVVELVSSGAFRVAAHVDGDLRPVTYIGFPAPAFHDPSGLASNIPSDIVTDPNKPIRLVTSRLGGAFPDGLTIGYIRNLDREPDGLFQRADVWLNPSLVELQEVAVLVPILRKNIEPGELKSR